MRLYLNIAKSDSSGKWSDQEKMIVVGNGATQKTFLKSRSVIFRCQKYVKKGT